MSNFESFESGQKVEVVAIIQKSHPEYEAGLLFSEQARQKDFGIVGYIDHASRHSGRENYYYVEIETRPDGTTKKIICHKDELKLYKSCKLTIWFNT
jgi:hypothetical protein